MSRGETLRPQDALLAVAMGQDGRGKVFNGADTIPPDEFTRTAFYHGWWRPAGARSDAPAALPCIAGRAGCRRRVAFADKVN
jgi:hypothetical protein